ncbi:MAG: hypothetical protein FJ219_07400 [Ignavibacteria bacterium]|nr:hypothetical protein [Ignavibacteria bacterium]
MYLRDMHLNFSHNSGPIKSHFISILVFCLFFLVLFPEISHGQGVKPLRGIINNYAKVTKYHRCTKSVDVIGVFGFAPNQKVLMIQMQGARIDTTNTPAFGTVLQWGNAGNSEILVIDSIKGSTIIFKHAPMRQYDPEKAPVQLVTVPVYDSAEVNIFNMPLTCEPWNGSTGGVLAFEVRLYFEIAGIIDISGKGFNGGRARVGSGNYKVKDYALPDTVVLDAGEKGSGIAILSRNYLLGRGAPANGGGGGNAHNSGGGGGGNGGKGGIGSKDFPRHHHDTLAHIGGIGGMNLPYQQFVNDSLPRLFMGGGGGAGHDNNNASLSGGAGGGIAYIRANNVIIRDFAVIKNNGADVGGPKPGASNDGYGGGGAGGTVYFDVNRFISLGDTLIIETKGGKGGSTAVGMHGPGGGGAGGAVLFKNSASSLAIIDNIGGMPGLNTAHRNSYGAEQGQKGIIVSNVQFKESSFGVMSVSASKDTTICEKTLVQLSVKPIGGTGPYTYRWEGMNITNTDRQNTTARPTKDEVYRVIVTDSNGCVDYALVSVKVLPAPTLSVPSNIIKACKGDTIILSANSTQDLTWLATKGLLENKGQKVRCIVDSTRTYTVYAETQSGCSAIDTIRVEMEEAPTVSGIQRMIEICPEQDSIAIPGSFTFGGVPPYTYVWYTQNDTIARGSIFKQINVKPSTTTVFQLAITSPIGCVFRDSISVIVNPKPKITQLRDTILCKGDGIMLDASGSDAYEWLPITGISDPTIANPIATPQVTTTYIVKGMSSKGCTIFDTVTITIVDPPIKPIISRRNDTLFVSGNGSQYEWLLNGTVLAKGRDSIKVIDTSGFYAVRAYSQYCSTLSDSMFVSIGNARIILDSLIVNNNEKAIMNISIVDTSGIEGAGIAAVELRISWNATVAEILNQGFSQVTGDSIKFATLYLPMSNAPILTTLNIRGLLGNAPSTSVTIEAVKPIGGILKYTTRNGNVIIGDICYEGGIRLWHPDKSFAKAAISVNPHPIVQDADIILRIPEQGPFSLRAYSSTGSEFPIVKGFTLPGVITAILPYQGLSPGMYMLLLETRTERCSIPIIIQK